MTINTKHSMHRLYGSDFAILAEFPDTEEGTAQANAYMLAIPGASVLEVTGGRIILVHKDDKGSDAPRPPSDRGQGRKPLSPEQRAVSRSVRLTPAQWEQYARLGGAEWLRAAIERTTSTKQGASHG